jgi:cystathionine gamma-lyase
VTDSNIKKHLSTRVIHGGQAPDPTTGAVMPPIYATSTFVQESPGVHKGLDYGRSHNPTRWALERCVADLEGGSAAFAFASGLAAISTVLELADSGSHIIAWSWPTAVRTSSPATTCTAAPTACSNACANAAPVTNSLTST